jgi:hypothetical protein
MAKRYALSNQINGYFIGHRPATAQRPDAQRASPSARHALRGERAPPPGCPRAARRCSHASGGATAASPGCGQPPNPQPCSRRNRRTWVRRFPERWFPSKRGRRGLVVRLWRHDGSCAGSHPRCACVGRARATDQADSLARPLRRRSARIARPARVRMRRRKPCFLARRRLFGWKVRLLTMCSSRISVWAGRRPPLAHDREVQLSWACGGSRSRTTRQRYGRPGPRSN